MILRKRALGCDHRFRTPDLFNGWSASERAVSNKWCQKWDFVWRFLYIWRRQGRLISAGTCIICVNGCQVCYGCRGYSSGRDVYVAP